MSNLMINKLKQIDNTRKDLENILETKGIDLSNSNKSLSSLVGNVSQLSLQNEVNQDSWEGVIRQEDPGTYWKGDEDWGNIIDIDEIMSADTEEYTCKAFFLIRCSDNAILQDNPTGYTAKGLIGFQAYRFSDQAEGDPLGTSSSHKFDSNKDIIAPNGERFRWIIGYSNSTTAITMWQSRYLEPEAVVYWSGEYRGICFEDCNANSQNEQNYMHYYDAAGKYQYTYGFSFTNFDANALRCVAPRYFEVKEDVITQFIIGDYDKRYSGAVSNDKTKTIIIDGTCVVEFMRNMARALTYERLSKAGYEKQLYLSGHYMQYEGSLYCKANVSGCKGPIYCNTQRGYIELSGNTLGNISPGTLMHANILCDDVGTISSMEGSIDSNFECKNIKYSVNERAFKDFDGHIKFTKIGRTIGKYAFQNCKYMPTEVIVEAEEGYTGSHSLGYGAFINTPVEKIDLSNSRITTLSTYTTSDPNYSSDPITYGWSQPFYGAERLKIIHLPKCLTSIPAYGLSRLPVETVTLPEAGMTSIGNHAFFDCPKLVSISPLPSSIQSLGTNIFDSCYSLLSVEINSETMTTLPNRLFNQCHSLEKVTLPKKCTSIGEGAFAACRSLKNVVLPNTVNTIGSYAFEYCYSLESILYEDENVGSMSNLNVFCFQDCLSLHDIFDLSNLLGHSSKDVYYSYFQNCKSLELTVLAKKPTNAHDSNYANNFYKNTNAKILVPQDYAYASTLYIGGANWCMRNFLDFLQSIPDRTGGTATKFNLGGDFRRTYYTNSGQDSSVAYSVYSVYKNYYVKEIDGQLEYSDTQIDDTWILVTDYIAAKNCQLW